MLSGGTQRHPLLRYQSEEIEIYISIKISFVRVGIEPTSSRVYSYTTGFRGLFFYCFLLTEVTLHESAALSSATQHAMPPEFGGK